MCADPVRLMLVCASVCASTGFQSSHRYKAIYPDPEHGDKTREAISLEI